MVTHKYCTDRKDMNTDRAGRCQYRGEHINTDERPLVKKNGAYNNRALKPVVLLFQPRCRIAYYNAPA